MTIVCDAAAELATIAEQFPVEPLQYLPKTLRISFEEGIQMLQEAGFEVGTMTFYQGVNTIACHGWCS